MLDLSFPTLPSLKACHTDLRNRVARAVGVLPEGRAAVSLRSLAWQAEFFGLVWFRPHRALNGGSPLVNDRAVLGIIWFDFGARVRR